MKVEYVLPAPPDTLDAIETTTSRPCATLPHDAPIAADAATLAPEAERTPQRQQAAAAVQALSLDVLRAKLDAAIVAEQWAAVAVIGERIRQVERAGVVDLEAEREKRKR